METKAPHRKNNPAYRQIGPWLYHGEPITDNWQLWVSFTVLDYLSIGEPIIRLLIDSGTPFRIPKDTISHYQTNTGELGTENIGKVIVVFTASARDAAAVAEALVMLTEKAKGITVPGALHLGGTVYTEVRKNHHFGPKATLPKEPSRFIGAGYIPANIIKTGPKGDILQAVNARRFAFNWCLIKQGKPYAADDEHGRNVRHRLMWQRELLARLTGFVPVPRVVDYIENETGTYLVTEYVEGKSLTEHIPRLLNGKTYGGAKLATRLKILSLFQQLTVILVQLHGIGIIHRDITAGNLIVDKKGKLHLIDFELAYDLAKHEPNPPFVHGTLGYVAPEQAKYALPAVQEDLYSFGALLYFALTGQPPATALQENKSQSLAQLPQHCRSIALYQLSRDLLQDDPAKRPGLGAVQQVLQQEVDRINTSPLERSHGPVAMKWVEEAVVAFLFLFLIITGGAKFFNLQQFGYDMNGQPITSWLKPFLTYAIPTGHLLLGAAILVDKTRLYGLMATIAVISGYIAYIVAIRNDLFAYQPCSCTWIYKQMTYTQTLQLNLTVLLWAAFILSKTFLYQFIHFLTFKFNRYETH